ncbi:MAG: FAD-dependent oxidoreductase, partial [Bradyrhizobium sp.]
MAEYDVDLFVIGGGSGGVRAARIAAGYGAKVMVAEEYRMGGTCVIRGCVPKKLFVIGSHIHHEIEDAAGFGWSVGERSFDWARLIENKDREIARLNSVYARLLDDAGVARIEGRARVVDAHTVEVGERRFTAANLLVATGGWPTLPAIPGIEHAITSNEAFHLSALPERVIVVGGGYIAVEFAGIFHGLGAQTVELYRGELFMRGFDHDLRTALAEEMRKKGIDLRFNAKVARIEKRATALHAWLEDGSELDADQILYATGRAPNSAGIGLEKIGVALDESGAVVVDEHLRTSVPNVFAIGDVTNRLNLTPVAIHEGMAVAATLFK